MVIKFLPQFKDELKMLIMESKWGGKRWLLHHLCIHLQFCVRSCWWNFHLPTTRNFFLHNAFSGTIKMIHSMGYERGNFWMKAKHRSELLGRDNFLLDRAVSIVNCGIRGWRKGLLRPIMSWVGIVGSDEGKLRGGESITSRKGDVIQ
jgi:hypothetical protein